VQYQRGDLASAEASLTRVLAIFEEIHGPDHPEVARTLGNLGSAQSERGDLDGMSVVLTGWSALTLARMS
jgi:hypothetical protein